jgi:hypothetical protein
MGAFEDFIYDQLPKRQVLMTGTVDPSGSVQAITGTYYVNTTNNSRWENKGSFASPNWALAGSPIATNAEVNAGTDTTKSITPAGLSQWWTTNLASDTRFITSAERTKLSGIAAGATAYTHPANHPPSIITQDASNRFVTDAEKATWNAKASTSVATTSTAGLMSSTDKTKLDGVSGNEEWQFGEYDMSGYSRQLSLKGARTFVEDIKTNIVSYYFMLRRDTDPFWNTLSTVGDVNTYVGNTSNVTSTTVYHIYPVCQSLTDTSQIGKLKIKF